LVFTGTYEHSIDAKNRLAIPSDVRALLQSRIDRDQSTYLYVTLGEGQALCLYTEEGFEQRAEELDHSELDPDQLLTYERLMFSLARRVELDKQGRVRLPDNLLTKAGLGSDVVLLGVKDHLEVRDRVVWQEHVQQMLELQPQILMNPRRAMGRTGSAKG
jgi:MraZ protein